MEHRTEADVVFKSTKMEKALSEAANIMVKCSRSSILHPIRSSALVCSRHSHLLDPPNPDPPNFSCSCSSIDNDTDIGTDTDTDTDRQEQRRRNPRQPCARS